MISPAPASRPLATAPPRTARTIVQTSVITALLLVGAFLSMRYIERRAVIARAAEELDAVIAATDSALAWQAQQEADADSLVLALQRATDPVASAAIYYHARRWSMPMRPFDAESDALEALAAGSWWSDAEQRSARAGLRAVRDSRREWDAAARSTADHARIVSALPLEPAVFAATAPDTSSEIDGMVQRPLATQLLSVEPAQVKAVMLALDLAGQERAARRVRLLESRRAASALLERLRPAAEPSSAAVPDSMPGSASPPRAAAPPPAIDSLATRFSQWIAGRDGRDGTAAYQRHVQAVRNTLELLQRTKLAPIAEFGARELRDAQEARVLLYPFAGGDILYADAFFPAADTVLMFGLEPVGTLFVPEEVTEARRLSYLAQLREATATANQLGFFVTNRMEEDFRGDLLNGVIHPILYYLAWQGFEVVRIEPKGGDPAAIDGEGIPGVRVVVRKPGRSGERVIEYLRVDVSNAAIARDDAILRRIARHDGAHVYLKAGSYLLHMDKFSRVRDVMLQHAGAVLQDDSGFPFASLTGHFEETRVFGSYERTIPLFTWALQPGLQRRYAETPDVAPVPFRIGYAAQIGSTNLQYATRKRP